LLHGTITFMIVPVSRSFMSSSSNNKAGGASRGWVLVIDDDAPIREMVAVCLAEAQVEVVGASGGAEALQLLAGRSEEPVLTLIDVLMPGMDGLTLAQKLRSRLKRGTMVVMSGHLSDVSWWPVELRDVAFLPKPFRLAELNDLLAAAQATFQPRN
jgi:two-component system, cell cycle sensor histidine kinase and response regulator CckA